VFVTGSFAKQIAEAELGLRKPVIEVGDLTPRRDWTDVRDVAKAYWLGIRHCDPGDVYVIASGTAYAIQDVLDILMQHARIPLTVRVAPDRLRPSDVPLLLGDSGKFREKTGWQPEIPFEQTLVDLFDDWRHRLATQQQFAAVDPIATRS
jgi:GDP-4-dehydro-6-deoxy-D-mannose reductase